MFQNNNILAKLPSIHGNRHAKAHVRRLSGDDGRRDISDAERQRLAGKFHSVEKVSSDVKFPKNVLWGWSSVWKRCRKHCSFAKNLLWMWRFTVPTHCAKRKLEEMRRLKIAVVPKNANLPNDPQLWPSSDATIFWPNPWSSWSKTQITSWRIPQHPSFILLWSRSQLIAVMPQVRMWK